MRILHYIPSIDETSGGVGAYMQLIAKGLNKRVDLVVVTVASPQPRKIDCAALYTVSNWKRPLALKRDWCTLLKEIKPDVVHVNGCWTPDCAMLQWWAQQLGYKVVLTPHGMLEPWIIQRHYWTRKLPALLLYQKAAIRNADLLHATAESERKNLLSLGWNKRITVIGNCVNSEEISIKHSWQLQKRILFLSRIHIKKGIHFLIEACAELKDELKGWQVDITGPGDKTYIEDLKRMTNKLGISDMVNFIGPIYGDSKYELYRKADIFILPTYSENFGIVIAEALAAGTPVITTKGTPWEELETKHCGWWTEIGTKPLTSALRNFLRCDETELEDMGCNGRKLIEEKYSTDIISQQFVHMYKEIQATTC